MSAANNYNLIIFDEQRQGSTVHNLVKANMEMQCRNDSSLLAFVLERSRGFNFVAFQLHLAHLFLQANAHTLPALAGLPCVTDDIVLEDQAVRLAANTNASSPLLYAVVLDDIALQAVAMACHAFALFTEADAILVIGADLIIPQHVVGVLVADGDAEATVSFQEIVLKQAVLYSPAEE